MGSNRGIRQGRRMGRWKRVIFTPKAAPTAICCPFLTCGCLCRVLMNMCVFCVLNRRNARVMLYYPAVKTAVQLAIPPPFPPFSRVSTRGQALALLCVGKDTKSKQVYFIVMAPPGCFTGVGAAEKRPFFFLHSLQLRSCAPKYSLSLDGTSLLELHPLLCFRL